MRESKSLKAAVVQFQHQAGNKKYNLLMMEKFIEQAAVQGVKILTFPEMCITGYWHVPKLTSAQVHALAEPLDTGTSVALIRSLAVSHQMLIGAGLIERADDGRLYNTYVACLPDGTLHAHRKLHAFEHPAINSGDSFTVFDTPWGVKVGILICWDNNLVENVRATALLGADILLAPHQTGGTHSRSPHGMKPIAVALWEQRESRKEEITAAFRGANGREWLLRWLPARAHDNGLFILFSNGVGADDDEVRTGNAMILDPYGRIIDETCAAADAMVCASLDLSLMAMSTGRRWIHGRRPELYHILTERQGYERDAITARFSEEVPERGDKPGE
ncbi:nitrilase family protein [Rouxiella badensis]|uniref:nitrilase family protein n=1 Tax=Rouxiella badensis TaxID=1646377 RepID=UPI0013EEF547|nr:nitrilase family protein [Rouxiella badensis]MCC3719348.1 nitrilase family protein [Rouxiella badensis]MCC3728598.1 nitrilase family protein [Rouxiella badensis]MCC3735531.1 nitrilase family protein [Rouxiella badensis]MCC3739406.1 nitrilase family protein [Rouxiella badensis]MCC3760828.1 nitrilase family protein [Rouxiella badensis]